MKIEIKEKETEAINWNIPQLVITDDGDVVITTGEHKDDTFEGYNLNQKRFSDGWAKRCFKKFNRKITLSND